MNAQFMGRYLAFFQIFGEQFEIMGKLLKSPVRRLEPNHLKCNSYSESIGSKWIIKLHFKSTRLFENNKPAFINNESRFKF